MEFTVDNTVNGILVINPIGRIDLISAGWIKQRLASIVAGGQHRLVVNLANVSFIDSSGLGALIGGLKAARHAGGDLRIAQPSEQARLILRLTKLDQVLQSYETVEEACSGYESAGIS